MPLAHPVRTNTTKNYGEPLLVVAFEESRPGETLDSFEYRIENPPSAVWGQRGPRQERTELIFTRDAAVRLIEMLRPYAGR